jgi:hypothetical protein
MEEASSGSWREFEVEEEEDAEFEGERSVSWALCPGFIANIMFAYSYFCQSCYAVFRLFDIEIWRYQEKLRLRSACFRELDPPAWELKHAVHVYYVLVNTDCRKEFTMSRPAQVSKYSMICEENPISIFFRSSL